MALLVSCIFGWKDLLSLIRIFEERKKGDISRGEGDPTIHHDVSLALNNAILSASYLANGLGDEQWWVLYWERSFNAT